MTTRETRRPSFTSSACDMACSPRWEVIGSPTRHSYHRSGAPRDQTPLRLMNVSGFICNADVSREDTKTRSECFISLRLSRVAFTSRQSSDCTLETEGENQLPLDDSHRHSIERPQVFYKSVFGDRLNVVQLNERVAWQVRLASERYLSGISLPDGCNFCNRQLVQGRNDSLASQNRSGARSSAPTQIELPDVTTIHFSPQAWMSRHSSARVFASGVC